VRRVTHNLCLVANTGARWVAGPSIGAEARQCDVRAAAQVSWHAVVAGVFICEMDIVGRHCKLIN
jgi:hypothetical protein